MQELTPRGRQEVTDLARRYGVSTDAAMHLLAALVNGNGTLAQFRHPELGGAGQWMQGGMTMVGDLFDNALKARVNGLCAELANLLTRQPFLAAPPSGTGLSGAGSNWWPAHLGVPAAAGAQHRVRYAYFPEARRLAVESDGHLTVYDTLDHQIGGVAQHQGSEGSLAFTSQHGLVGLASLPRIPADNFPQNAPGPAAGGLNRPGA